MINAATFLENTIVPHKAYKDAVNRLDYFIKSAKGGMEEPVGFALLGEPRAGKSLVIKTLAVRYPKDHDKDGLRLPFLSVTLPSKPTIKGLGEEMLKEFDPTDDRRYTEVQLTRRLRALMKNCGTIVLALDEFQHFYDKRSHTVWHYAADWLKVLVDSVGCILIVSGLPECTVVIKQNRQLAGRFRAPIVMPRFSWQNQEERKEFIACLEAFHDVINPHIFLPLLHSPEWAFRCYCATGGLIGYLKKFLAEVVIHGDMTKKASLTLEDFDVAYKNYLYSEEELKNVTIRPFTSEFNATPSVAALQDAAKVGAASVEEVKTRSSLSLNKGGRRGSRAQRRG
jgi:Bacterial TniB protein